MWKVRSARRFAWEMCEYAPILLLFGGTAGCASAVPSRAPLSELAARASYELDCAPQWLRLTNIDERIKGVDGCGRRAVYVELCEWADAACFWWSNAAFPPPGLGPRIGQLPFAMGAQEGISPSPAPPPRAIMTSGRGPLLDRQ